MRAFPSRRLGITALALAALFSVLTPAVATAQQRADAGADPQDGVTYTITAVHSGKCLQVYPGKEHLQGEWIVQMPCDGSAAQRHTIVRALNNQFHIKTSNGMCWNIYGGRTNNFTPIIQWPCQTQAWADRFTFWRGHYPAEGVEIASADSPKLLCGSPAGPMCVYTYREGLHVVDASTADAQRLVLHKTIVDSPTGSKNYTFRFTRV
jgi:hypothetical protein